MHIEIISIGGELLIGHTVNTNFAFIAGVLAENGYAVDREVCIPDTSQDVQAAVRDALNRAHLVITIGGLGPTRDDLTRDAVAALLNCPLTLSERVFDHISHYLSRRAVKLPDDALKTQSMVPQGATALLNGNGTAPGLWCPVDAKHGVVMLPGPPRELQPLFTEQVIPRIHALGSPDWYRRTLRVCGIPESLVANRTESVLSENDGLDMAYCARPGIVDVRLTAPISQKKQVDDGFKALHGEFGDAILAEDDDLVAALARELVTRELTVAVAESCTGGGIGSALTERAGASVFFEGGIIAYSNTVKHRELGVRSDVLETSGAVSEPVAHAMVRGVCDKFQTDTGIAVTGIAGPGGGTTDKPVGLVFIATAVHDEVQVERRVYPGNRDTVRQRTINSALNQLREQLIAWRSDRSDSAR